MRYWLLRYTGTEPFAWRLGMAIRGVWEAIVGHSCCVQETRFMWDLIEMFLSTLTLFTWEKAVFATWQNIEHIALNGPRYGRPHCF